MVTQLEVGAASGGFAWPASLVAIIEEGIIMNESGHQFRRYIRRMMGRKIQYQPLCECGWRGTLAYTESSAWADYCIHSEKMAVQ